MSGRARVTLADGRIVRGYRKTLARRGPSVPADERPDFVLRFLLPTRLAFSVAEGPTNIAGVTVVSPGPVVEVRGKRWEFVVQQACDYLGRIARGVGHEIAVTAELTRKAYPRAVPEQPYHPDVKRNVELVAVPFPAVVVPRAMDAALVYPIKG